MIIDERIFNELDKINLKTDDGMELLDEYVVRMWGRMTPKEQYDFCEDNGADKDDPDEAYEAQDFFCDEMIENIISLYRVPQGSVLEAALFTYGRAKFGTNLFDTFDRLGLIMINNEAYLDTGWGYDIIDSDLLGGTGNGDAKREFLKIVNEND